MADDRPVPDPEVVDADGADEAADSIPEQTPDPSHAPSSRGVTLPVAVPVTVALVLGLAIGLILGWVLPRPGADTAAADAGVATTDSAPTNPDTQAATVLTPALPQPIDGGPDGTEEYGGLVIADEGEGPLVEVFEDYVCPFCARLELSAGAQLREAALGGEFRLVMHPIAFLTEDSPRAANASACVYQHHEIDTWVSFHELVYQRQDPSEAVGQYTNEALVEMAEQVGAADQATTACIDEGTFNGWIEALTQQSFQRGVRGTPTLTVDGTVTDVAPLVQ